MLLSFLGGFCDLPQFQGRLPVVTGDAHRDPLYHYLPTDCLGKATSILFLTVTVVKNDIGKGKDKERKVRMYVHMCTRVFRSISEYYLK